MNKIKLIQSRTPLYRMNYMCGNTNIWIKRDDLIDFAFGGNKVRLFEYIAAVVKKRGVNRIVTYGSQYSNYLRVAATVCSVLGIECDLIVLKEGEELENWGGNATLLDILNANVIYCPLSEAHDFIDEYQRELKEANIDYFWIPGGGHIPEAALGYVDASQEIIEQLDENRIKIDAVFLPCGTGTTQAGLIYGFSDQDYEVYGVSVARPRDVCEKAIAEVLREMTKHSKYEEVIRKKGINVFRCETHKYGIISSELKTIISHIASSDGMFLDPIYNAVAFLEMTKMLNTNSDYRNVLYINTGGQPNIFKVKK